VSNGGGRPRFIECFLRGEQAQAREKAQEPDEDDELDHAEAA
jgi:hypothetical protein